MSQPNGIREKFERSFSSRHGRNHRALANDGKRSKDCEVCQEDKKLNPKGYYLTFLSEQNCYWNREMMNDVADFFLSEFSTELNNLEERIKGEKKTHKIPYQALHFTGCPHCGADANMDFVEAKMNEVFEKGLSEALSLLEELRNKYGK